MSILPWSLPWTGLCSDLKAFGAVIFRGWLFPKVQVYIMNNAVLFIAAGRLISKRFKINIDQIPKLQIYSGGLGTGWVLSSLRSENWDLNEIFKSEFSSFLKLHAIYLDLKRFYARSCKLIACIYTMRSRTLRKDFCLELVFHVENCKVSLKYERSVGVESISRECILNKSEACFSISWFHTRIESPKLFCRKMLLLKDHSTPAFK